MDDEVPEDSKTVKVLRAINFFQSMSSTVTLPLSHAALSSPCCSSSFLLAWSL